MSVEKHEYSEKDFGIVFEEEGLIYHSNLGLYVDIWVFRMYFNAVDGSYYLLYMQDI